MKQDILKLNANFQPIGTSNWKETMTNIVSGAVYPVDVSYYQNKHGEADLDKVEALNVIKTFEEWFDLPVRPYDDFINAPNRVVRIPPVVVCGKYDKIYHKKVIFPTKNNIWKRDNYTCAYTGKKLTRDELSVDHIIPKSRGGGNTWTNLITCEKATNVLKADRTPKEAGMRLLFKPHRPENGMIFDSIREEWYMFLDADKYQ
jgi:5-methylcytosine-specific restriction endonuclease McrA